MCGIAGIIGEGGQQDWVRTMLMAQEHRGPDAQGIYCSASRYAILGHNRLKVIDLSDRGNQPMTDPTGRYTIVYNGEIYNYLELREMLRGDYVFKTQTDTEVLLAGYLLKGESFLDYAIGMFSFAIWDEKERRLFAARDRFGIKPFYYSVDPKGRLFFASEIKTLHASGQIERIMDEAVWATYFVTGLSDFGMKTFWSRVSLLPPGCWLEWKEGKICVKRWYEFMTQVGVEKIQSDEDAREEYLSLLKDSIRLRFRSDVALGINLSGGLDSSLLLELVQAVHGRDNDVKIFTFTTGDYRYDESLWVEKMLETTRHPLIPCRLDAKDVPAMAVSVARSLDEPFGGLPTLAYARLFEIAQAQGVVVLLDGQGMDEQWAGYDYYLNLFKGITVPIIQGSRSSPVCPDALDKSFLSRAEKIEWPIVFKDDMRQTQYRDLFFTKIPRALRFNDRISMRVSTELREPFLDHRLVEFAFRQPESRKIVGGKTKVFLRQLADSFLPESVAFAPKRAVQTPQREWLRGVLSDWVEGHIQQVQRIYGGRWFDRARMENAWQDFKSGDGDNSFYIWQWVNLSLLSEK